VVGDEYLIHEEDCEATGKWQEDRKAARQLPGGGREVGDGGKHMHIMDEDSEARNKKDHDRKAAGRLQHSACGAMGACSLWIRRLFAGVQYQAQQECTCALSHLRPMCTAAQRCPLPLQSARCRTL
jgi:hypothetical protein